MKIYVKVLMAVLLCGFFSACCNQDKEQTKSATSLEKDKMFGSVKKITSTQFALALAEDGSVYKDSTAQEMNAFTVFTYNEDGNVVLSELYSIDSSLVGSQAFEYDNRNNAVKIEINNVVANAKMTQTFIYDKRNRLLEMSFMDKDGKVEAKEINEYYGDEQIVRYCNAEGKELSRYINRLDSAGNIVDNRWYADSIATSHYSAEFDKMGNRTDVFVYGVQDSVENHFTIAYDSIGNIINQRGFDRNGDLMFEMSYVYVFDSIGNWTSCTEYQMSDSVEMPVSLIERRIEYYD